MRAKEAFYPFPRSDSSLSLFYVACLNENDDQWPGMMKISIATATLIESRLQ